MIANPSLLYGFLQGNESSGVKRPQAVRLVLQGNESSSVKRPQAARLVLGQFKRALGRIEKEELAAWLMTTQE